MASSSHNLLALLKRHFGYDDFRPGQAAVISNALAGRHSLVVMPTGGGKSLCYQLPALALGGLTLVVSPLIALMKDQVDALRANEISAEFLNSSQDNATAASAERKAQSGQVSLLYVAPERVSMPGFRRFLRTLDLKLIAIDEAHCISEWGHDFRPDYRQLSELRTLFPQVPVMALTATATESVRKDIVQQLALENCAEFVSGFDRPNLTYRVLPRNGARDALLKLLDERKGQSAIIYCLSRRDTEELAADLSANGHPTVAYHAGLDDHTRRRTQERFIDGEVPVVAATIAFGMGIDKPDIRLVVHYALPKSIEGYYQETGRAGRDGLPSDCVLFFTDGDQRRHDYFINRITDGAVRRTAQRQLQRMVDYGRLQTCRRKYLLEHFGDQMLGDSCDNCDVCLSERASVDVTVVAQKILSAVIRTGERFGVGHVIDVLLGANRKRVRDLEHNELSVFGIVSDYDRAALRQVANALIDQGLMESSGDQYPIVRVTNAGRTWLRSRRELTLELAVTHGAGLGLTDVDKRSGRPLLDAPGVNADLYARLRSLRRRLADGEGVPAFVVFNDTTLRNLAGARPTTSEQMLRVSGVGPAKLERYGAQFLAAIKQHLDAQPPTSANNAGLSTLTATTDRLSPTQALTVDLVRQGHTLSAIAERRGLTIGTVVGHIEQAIKAGASIDLTPLMPPRNRTERIKTALRTVDSDRLAPVKDRLDDSYSYDEIRLVRLAHRRNN